MAFAHPMLRPARMCSLAALRVAYPAFVLGANTSVLRPLDSAAVVEVLKMETAVATAASVPLVFLALTHV